MPSICFARAMDRRRSSLLNFRIGKRPEDEWTEEDRDTLKSSFYRFRNAFRAVVQAEDPENIIGDAFLSYLNVYPYDRILNKSSMELQKELQAMKEELQLQGSRKNVRLRSPTSFSA